jgi:hypothetical protein
MATDRFNGVVASLAIKVRCVLGAEANVVLNGTGLIEGIAVADGDRVLLTAQTDPIENGVWNAVSNGPWTRAADWDGNRDIEKGSTVWAGSAGQDDKLWQVQTDGIIQPGTTAVSITELFNPAAPTAASLADVTGVGNDTLGNSIIISSTNPALTFKDTNNTIGTATGSMIFTDSVDAEIGSVRAITSNVVVESVNGLVILQADNGYAISSHFIAGDPGTEATGINVGGTTYQSALKVSDIGGSNLAQMILHRHSTTIGPVIVGSRSNTDDSSHGLVTDGQAMLWLVASGWDGAAYQRAGEIQIDVDGTAAASDMPGRIILATTPSGAIVPVERLRISSEGGVYLNEMSAADTDIAGRGQFWVRDDAPNLPMFTDDTGVDYILNDAGGGGSTGSGVWTTITPSGADTDPGAGNMKLSTGNPASITVLYVSETDADGNDLSNLFNTVNDTDGYFIMRVFDATTSQYRIYMITSMVDNTTYWRLNLDYMRGNGATSITDGTEVTLEFHTEAWVEAGVEASLLSDILYWEGSTNRWEASGNQIRVNPASPPGGGRLYLGSTSGAALGSPYLYFDVGSVSAYLWQAHNSASSGFDFYERVEYGSIFQHQFGFATAGTPVKTAHFDSSNRFVIDSTGAFFIQEKGAAATDVAGLGQIWVRNDAPNVLMFTDDTGVDYELNAVPTINPRNADRWNFETSLTTPPATNGMQFNSATPSAVTVVYFDDTALSGLDAGPLISKPGANSGWLMTLYDPTDFTSLITFRITGTISDNVGWWGVTVTWEEGSVLPTDGEPYTIVWQEPVLPTGASGIGGNSTIRWDGTNDQWVDTAGEFQIDSSVVGTTRLTTNDGVFHIDGSSQIRMTAGTTYVAYTNNNSFVGFTGSYMSTGLFGGDLLGDFGNGNNDLRLVNGTGLLIGEKASAHADLAAHGQLWVENTTSPANRLGFTDDAGNDGFFGAFAIELRESAGRPYGATGAGGGMIYVRDFVPSTPVWVNDGDGSAKLVDYSNTFDMEFSTSTTAADPGDGLMKYNSATPASVTAIYFDQLDVYVGDQAHNILALVRGDILEIMSHGTPSKFHRFRVNGTVTDNTGWYTVPVTPMSSGSLHAANEIISVTVHKGPALLQNYAIEAPTEYVPTGTTQTLDYRDGPAFEVDLESVTANPTITLSNFPSTGYGQMVVKVRQDSVSSRTITWAGGTFVNAGGTAHTMNPSVDAISIFTFESWDGGTTIYAAGADYS